MRTRVKICGITNVDDALAAAHLGADALGFIFVKGGKRYITPGTARSIIAALPPFITKVGVFVNESPEKMGEIRAFCGLDCLQIYAGDFFFDGAGSRPGPSVTDGNFHADGFDAAAVIMAYRVRGPGDIEAAQKSPAIPLFDSYNEKVYGGSGKRFDWGLLADFGRPYILAGGINITNIEEAIACRPYAVDIASGAEKSPGLKDHALLRTLFQKIKG